MSSAPTKRLILLLAVVLVVYFVLTSATVYTAGIRVLQTVKQLLGLKTATPKTTDQPPVDAGRPSLPTSIVYKQAENSKPPNMTRMTLYFADADIMFLVPVTRTIALTKSPIRETLTELFRGPAPGSGLLSASAELGLRDLALRTDGTLRIDLPAQVVQATAGWGSSISMLTLDSILHTVGEYAAVKQAQFLVGGKTVTTLFHGLAAGEPIPVPTLTSGESHLTVYYAILAGSRAYLVPDQTEVARADTVTLIKRAVDQLSKGKKVGDYQLYPTLPGNVTLLGVDLSGKTAMVNFSGEFAELFTMDPARQALVLDSLLYTLTSFPEVEQVQILVEGQKLQKMIGNRNIGEPLRRPQWINPE
ncbi:MAG: GerMN domain-containing protein [Bacillota bacterium]|nr:GerMN domain-containing protein [Bacillota bacterium]